MAEVKGRSVLWRTSSIGIATSKEGDDRVEVKIDAIPAAVDPKNADALIDKMDREYARHTDSRWTTWPRRVPPNDR